MIPWGQFEESYCSNLSKSGQGTPAFSVRMALATLIIKEHLGVTDEGNASNRFARTPIFN